MHVKDNQYSMNTTIKNTQHFEVLPQLFLAVNSINSFIITPGLKLFYKRPKGQLSQINEIVLEARREDFA